MRTWRSPASSNASSIACRFVNRSWFGIAFAIEGSSSSFGTTSVTSSSHVSLNASRPSAHDVNATMPPVLVTRTDVVQSGVHLGEMGEHERRRPRRRTTRRGRAGRSASAAARRSSGWTACATLQHRRARRRRRRASAPSRRAISAATPVPVPTSSTRWPACTPASAAGRGPARRTGGVDALVGDRRRRRRTASRP